MFSVELAELIYGDYRVREEAPTEAGKKSIFDVDYGFC